MPMRIFLMTAMSCYLPFAYSKSASLMKVSVVAWSASELHLQVWYGHLLLGQSTQSPS
jgi:hypothetical protein